MIRRVRTKLEVWARSRAGGGAGGSRPSHASTTARARRSGSNCVPAQRVQLLERLRRASVARYGRCEVIASYASATRDDACLGGDVGAGDAAPDSRVRPSVRGGAGSREGAARVRKVGHEQRAGGRMPAHLRLLDRVQRPGLGEDLAGDGELADVVEQAARPHVESASSSQPSD